MNVEEKDFVSMFRKIAQLRQEVSSYILAPDKIPASVDDLCDVVSRMYGLKIEVRKVTAPGVFLRGALLRFFTSAGKRALILVRSGQAEEWTRFTVAKELSQIILDEEEDFTIDAVQTITNIMHSINLDLNGDGGHSLDSITLGERLSELCAMEFLYPAEFHAQDHEKIAALSSSFGRLALKWKMPAVAIAWAHQEDYRAICAACRGK